MESSQLKNIISISHIKNKERGKENTYTTEIEISFIQKALNYKGNLGRHSGLLITWIRQLETL